MRFNFFTNAFIELEQKAEKLAISGSDKDSTWAEAKAIVDRYIENFQELKIPKGNPVILYGHKEHLFPLAMLACMQYDLPYIPIDKIYPQERVKKIMEISGAQLLINCGKYEIDAKLPVIIDHHLNLRVQSPVDYSKGLTYSETDPLRYILFTSGSTGEPKGVQITRSSLLSFCEWIQSDYPFSPDDVFLNQSLFTFDVSLYDLLGAFMSGGSMLLIDSDIMKDVDRLFGKLKNYGCSVWTSTPSFAYMYLRERQMQQDYLTDIRTFLFAGENLPVHVVRVLKEQFPSARVYNAYGPTEATVTTTMVEITAAMLSNLRLPIGYARPGSEILIENESNNPAELGELIISGDHVSIGYLKDEVLTARKFFEYKGKRAFRTGDLGYYSGDLIFFSGRNDEMIKFHGYRIELGEISSVIMESEMIEDAVTIPLSKGEEIKRIVSFVILKKKVFQSASETREWIRSYLLKKLPAYMVPGDFIIVDKFPLNTNQKIDKAGLVELFKQSKQLLG